MSTITKEVINQKEYLVAELEEREYLDEDCLAAVGSGQDTDKKAGIEGILPISYTQFEGQRMLRYDTNAYIPFAEYKKQIRSAESLSRVFLSILDTYQQTESYLLDPACFLLKQEYVYVEQKSGKAWLILYPVYDTEGMAAGKNGDTHSLFRDMLRGVRLPEEDMAFYGNLTYELDREEAFNIVSFRNLLSEKGGQKNAVREEKKPSPLSVQEEMQASSSETKKETEFGESVPIPAAPESPVIPPKPESRKFFDWLHSKKDEKSERGIRLPDDEELPKGFQKDEKSILDDFGGLKDKKKKEKSKKSREEKKEIQEDRKGSRTLPPGELTDDEPIGIPPTDDEYSDSYAATRKLYLKQSDTGEQILVRSFPFVIGREGSGLTVDASKTKVSRQHAVIKETIDGFTIRDVSKLGTFLDGERIARNEDVPLKDGMTVLLKEIAYNVVIEE